MRAQRLARARRRLPLESGMGPAGIPLGRPLLERQRLPAWLLAGALGPLPQYALPRPPSKRGLEALIE
jgi:hypothetical protein